MAAPLDRQQVRKYLEDFDLHSLFINMLGWDHGGESLEVPVADTTFMLEAIAHKRGLVAYQYIAHSDNVFPDNPTRQKIEKNVAKKVREHIIVYTTYNRRSQYWQWVKREQGHPDRMRQHIYQQGQPGKALIQKLERLAFTLDEEDDLTIVDVSERVRTAFDVEKVTRKFYERFKKELHVFLGFIDGISSLSDREWYASLMLNRMMFIYFIQKQGFLDGDHDYLTNRLQYIKESYGEDRFQTFYRNFLLRLFHEGLGQPDDNRTDELNELLGNIPYLNGGLFYMHHLEQANPEINIPDEAFEQVFAFFNAYQWHLDDQPLSNDNEINPDVLGYIFEKYINQKQMGAYYTKEDITGYISRNTIIPFLFEKARKECSVAFRPGSGVWKLLSANPDQYIYEAVRHDITYDIHQEVALTKKRELPHEISTGLNDVSQRGGWNKPASPDYALPTETWRELVARRQRYEEVHAKLEAGEITSINDLITYNLDMEKFAQDAIAGSEGPELVRAFWQALNTVSILDPTCGSGAFLFAALNILEPLYTTCLDTMKGLIEDLKHLNTNDSQSDLNDFYNILCQVKQHASESYFILKSIVVNNLYGMDIMEEAVEVCKLRLFLKLVAQLDDYKQLEPLPDIDFNIRAGNTLVGFTTLEGIQDALISTPRSRGSRLLYAEDKQKLDTIKKNASDADQAFTNFRELQTGQNIDANKFRHAKQGLQKQLNGLRDELDYYLASQYGINTSDKELYECWRNSHLPFHWIVEFYGIMSNGGFDVIIGNPPYVEYKKVKKDYIIADYETLSCGNLYAFMMERSKQISNSESLLSMIVPLSGHSTKRMKPLMDKFYKQFKSCYLFNISADAHPSILFSGVRFRLAIFIVSNYGKGIFTTGYTRWYAAERKNLFRLLYYINIGDVRYDTAIPKVSNYLHLSILQKMLSHKRKLRDKLTPQRSSDIVTRYHSAPVHWIRAHTNEPFFHSQRDNRRTSSKLKTLYQKDKIGGLQAILCSTSFFVWWLSHSDCYDLNRPEIGLFPMCSSDELEEFSQELEIDMQNHAVERIYNYKTTGEVRYDEFYMKKSKHIIDRIDIFLAEYYKFTPEELDFIMNYDIKYRIGIKNKGPL